MTTTSEKILSEMERMGRMKIKDLCAQMHWQYQKFRRRIKANDFSPADLALIAKENTIEQAVEWLKANVIKYYWYDPYEDNEGFNGEALIYDFKKAMEEVKV